jgi:hypothetical protein
VAKLVSEAWKNLSPKERGVYEEMSRLDKERYDIEKETYTGPWKILKQRKRLKDPDAPKRPMSAFLMYSNGKRAAVKREKPSLSNADISRLLAERWRSAPAEERKIFIDLELKQRQKYKDKLVKWRIEQHNQSLEQATAAESAMLAPQLASCQPSYFSTMGMNSQSMKADGLLYGGTSSWSQSTPGHNRTIPLHMPHAPYPANFSGAQSNAFSYVNTDNPVYYSQAYPFGMYSKFLIESLTLYPSLHSLNLFSLSLPLPLLGTDTEVASYAQARMNENAALHSHYQAQDYAAAAQQYYQPQHPFQYGAYGGEEQVSQDFGLYTAAVAPQGNHPNDQQYFGGSDSYLNQEPRR